jgi:large subunit ribosomal protein L13e
MKTRYGRGFTLEELRLAGLNPGFARSVGIAADHRRQDTSLEMRDLNVKRLKAYLAKLILFPSKTSRQLAKKAGAAKAEPMTEVKKEQKSEKPHKVILPEAPADKLSSAAAKEQKTEKVVMPAPERKLREKPQSITAEMKAAKTYYRIRLEKTKAKYHGIREKRAKIAQKEAEEKATKDTAGA